MFNEVRKVRHTLYECVYKNTGKVPALLRALLALLAAIAFTYVSALALLVQARYGTGGELLSLAALIAAFVTNVVIAAVLAFLPKNYSHLFEVAPKQQTPSNTVTIKTISTPKKY